MRVPCGFQSKKPGRVLKLIRSLYGAKDAPKLWADLLFNTLRKEGYTQSKCDLCLWYKKDIFLILYVDDCGISYKSEDLVDDLIASLIKRGFKLTKEGTFAEFLGIQYSTTDDGNIHLTQQGLIGKILDAMDMKDCKSNRLPAACKALGMDTDGIPFDGPWSYPSVVGMLFYLSTNTRPDIAFAVSQIARFTHSPKQSHAVAVKTLVRYLKGTIAKGTIVRKPSSMKLETFCDADFCSLYHHDPDDSVSSAKSRSGYVIKLAGCPLIWKSQLMQSIALSTAEAEYYSLSLAMRALLLIRALLLEMTSNIRMPPDLVVSPDQFMATVHEDNTAALSLAVNQRVTSRTRHYDVRRHFFWAAIQDSQVEVVYVDTLRQEADYLTKGMPVEGFERIRVLVQGW